MDYKLWQSISDVLIREGYTPRVVKNRETAKGDTATIRLVIIADKRL